jgi:CheY-like chemotaxis protein
MDGIEATQMIRKIDAQIPIVALTANIMSGDTEVYRASGMNDCVSKPFTSQEFWRCLMKYFIPVIDEKEISEQEKADIEMRQMLINSFVEGNTGKIDEIRDALNADDIKLAYRLVHTLRSNAGHLNKTLLQQAAAAVEENLKNGKNTVTPNQAEELEREFNAVMTELIPLVRKDI